MIDVFVLNQTSGGRSTFTVAAIRSTDQGETWSTPTMIARQQVRGVRDPDGSLPIRRA